jgi:MFS family permease
MTVLSKEAEEKEAKRLRTLNLVFIHMLSNISLSLLTYNSRTILLQQLCKGDAVKLSTYLSYWASAIGLGEFLLNPTVGRLSDAFGKHSNNHTMTGIAILYASCTGRKTFMLIAPFFCIVLKLVAATNPTFMTLTLEKVASCERWI